MQSVLMLSAAQQLPDHFYSGKMARRSYSLLQALEFVMRSESEDGEKSTALEETTSTKDEDTSSREDEDTSSSEDDSTTLLMMRSTSQYLILPPQGVRTIQTQRLNKKTQLQVMADTDELAAEWISHNGKILWFPTNKETLHFNPVPPLYKNKCCCFSK